MKVKEQNTVEKVPHRYRVFLTTALLTLMGVIVAGCNLLTEPSAVVETELSSTSSPLSGKAKYHISWTLHQNLPVPQDAEMLNQVEEQFGVDLDIWNMENNKYESLLDMKLAQGNIPDLFRIRQPQDLLKYQQQGVLAEIPVEMLKQYAPNLMRIIHEQVPAYENAGVIDGTYYGIPVINPTNIYRTPVVYRQDWLQKLVCPFRRRWRNSRRLSMHLPLMILTATASRIRMVCPAKA